MIARKGYVKMNERQLNKKIRQDADRVKVDVNTLVRDGTARVFLIDENITQIVEDLSTKVDEGAAQLSKGLEKLTGDAKKAVVETTETVMKDVGHGLSQYNTKVNEVAGKVPGGFVEKVTRYPWVAISIGLIGGVLLGLLMKPSRPSFDYL